MPGTFDGAMRVMHPTIAAPRPHRVAPRKVMYFYRISAMNSVGESPFSAEVSATAR